MKNRLFTDVKHFFNKELEHLVVLFIFFGMTILLLQIYQITEMNKIRNAVHHRYFNSVQTMQDLYGIQVNTRDGHIENNYQSPYKR